MKHYHGNTIQPNKTERQTKDIFREKHRLLTHRCLVQIYEDMLGHRSPDHTWDEDDWWAWGRGTADCCRSTTFLTIIWEEHSCHFTQEKCSDLSSDTRLICFSNLSSVCLVSSGLHQIQQTSVFNRPSTKVSYCRSGSLLMEASFLKSCTSIDSGQPGYKLLQCNHVFVQCDYREGIRCLLLHSTHFQEPSSIRKIGKIVVALHERISSNSGPLFDLWRWRLFFSSITFLLPVFLSYGLTHI